MKKVTILIPTNKPPNTPGDRTLRQTDNILVELRKNYKLNICWVLFQPEKHTITPNDKSQIINYQDYEDGIEILKFIKPDMILIPTGWVEIPTSIFSFIGKINNIPVVVTYAHEPYLMKNWTKSVILKKRMSIILSNKMLEPKRPDKKNRFRVIKFIINQYRFFLKTVFSSNVSIIKKIEYIIQFSSSLLVQTTPSPKIISGNLNLCYVQEVIDLLSMKGYDKSNLILAGNPDFDHIFEDIQKLKLEKKKHGKNIKILLCTSSWHEAGMGPKEIEDGLILSTINEISKKDEYSIDIKIHPSNSSKIEYEELVSKHPKTKIFQKESILELLSKYDLMITYGGSSVTNFAVLLEIPVLYVQYSKKEPEPFFHDGKVTGTCENIDELIPHIKKMISKKPSEKDRDEYIKKYMGTFDGNSTKRIAKEISKIL